MNNHKHADSGTSASLRWSGRMTYRRYSPSEAALAHDVTPTMERKCLFIEPATAPQRECSGRTGVPMA